MKAPVRRFPNYKPIFHLEPKVARPGVNQRAFLHCSSCEARLIEIANNQKISVRVPYFCIECQIDIAMVEVTSD